MVRGVSTTAVVCLGDRAQDGVLSGTTVVPVASLARVFSSLYTLKKWKVAEAAKSRASAMAQLRGYARRIWTPNLHGAAGWLLILSGS
jgi:hypothetical protein